MMNREQLIKDKLAKGTSVNFSRIAEKDENSLIKLLSTEKDELITVEDAIDAFLANPDLTINEDFINLKVKEANIKDRIGIIKGLYQTNQTKETND